jgi:Tfp pilus assembly protein PilF
MFEYRTGPDYTLALLSLSRRVSAAHAYFESGETKLAQKEVADAMEIVKQLETTQIVVK